MRVALLANLLPGVPYSTGWDFDAEFRLLGHQVHHFHEDYRGQWVSLTNAVAKRKVDVVIWNTTPRFAGHVGIPAQRRMLKIAADMGVPVVGVHLDRWWGLNRQVEIESTPFFTVPRLWTADGAHDHEWAERGINHSWLVPGIATRNVGRGVWDPALAHQIVFVGSWRTYHPEWEHRRQLISHLRRNYPGMVEFYPRDGQPLRGTKLADLYASAKVIVGDSCLVPTTERKDMHHYCSDRIPETLGRGGLLIHPRVDGITNDAWDESQMFCWNIGDWDELDAKIDEALHVDPEWRLERTEKNIKYNAEFHTYAARLKTILEEYR